MHRFNESGLVVDFLSNFLYNYWLPIYKTVKPGDYLVYDKSEDPEVAYEDRHDGPFYIYGLNLIQCTRSGYLQPNWDLKEDEQECRFNVIAKNYKIGGKFRKISDNFISNSDNYSIELHNRLGKFVESYSDITGINLNPYFNRNSNKCLDNMYIQQVITTENSDALPYELVDAYNKNYRVFMVPIRFNRSYTIALSCSAQLLMTPAFFSYDRKLLIGKVGHEIDISSEFMKDTECKYVTNLPAIFYTKPQLININLTNQELLNKYYKYEKNLYLLIQIPSTVASSLTVLEGDYLNNNVNNILSVSDIYKLSEYELNDLLTSKLSLLQLDTDETYPFADRLLEYLFDCVIDYTWELDGNIQKAQDLLPRARFDNLVAGVYDNTTRYRFYENTKYGSHTGKLDFCGHLDKDTEFELLNSILNIKGDF